MNNDHARAFQRLVKQRGLFAGVDAFTDTYPNYTHLGGGNTRQVFAHPTTAFERDVVIKIAHDSHTSRANRLEWKTYNNRQEELAGYLAPVYAVADNDAWLVQCRVDDTAPSNWSEVQEAFSAAGVGTLDIDTDNIGTLDGQPVAYDYPVSVE